MDYKKKLTALTEYVNNTLIENGFNGIVVDSIKNIKGENNGHLIMCNPIKIGITVDYLNNFDVDDLGNVKFKDDFAKYKILRMIGHEIGHSYFDQFFKIIKSETACAISGAKQNDKHTNENLIQSIRELRADIIGANLFKVPDRYIIDYFKENKYNVSDAFKFGYPSNKLRALASIGFNTLNLDTYKVLMEEIISDENVDKKVNREKVLNTFKNETLSFDNKKRNVIDINVLSLDDLIKLSETGKSNKNNDNITHEK